MKPTSPGKTEGTANVESARQMGGATARSWASLAAFSIRRWERELGGEKEVSAKLCVLSHPKRGGEQSQAPICSLAKSSRKASSWRSFWCKARGRPRAYPRGLTPPIPAPPSRAPCSGLRGTRSRTVRVPDLGPGADPLSSVGPQGAAAGLGDRAEIPRSPGKAGAGWGVGVGRWGGPSVQGGKALGKGAPQPRRGTYDPCFQKCLSEKTSLSFIAATSESRSGLGGSGGEGGPLGGRLCLRLSPRQVLQRDSCPWGCHRAAGQEALPQQSRG